MNLSLGFGALCLRGNHRRWGGFRGYWKEGEIEGVKTREGWTGDWGLENMRWWSISNNDGGGGYKDI